MAPPPAPVSTPSPAWVLRVALAVLRRPALWVVALVQAFRLARPGWWRHWPPVPVPDADYLRFRLETMYGTASGPGPCEPPVEDVLEYLDWCRRLPG